MGSTAIGRNARTVDVSPAFGSYSKIHIDVTEDLFYESGNDTGRTLSFSCPWGTQAMADNILAGLAGYQYQPFYASAAFVDPAAELGDGITVNGVYGGLFRQNTKFDPNMASDISAPQDEEIDHEFPFISKTSRELRRVAAQMQSEFRIQSDLISAKVSQTGGDNASFGWTLTEEGFVLSSTGNQVFKATSSGITVTGTINATAGNIGGCVIQNGVLKIDNANIGTINANKITAGTLSVDRISNGSLTGSKLANSTVTGGKIASRTISGGNVGYGTLAAGNTYGDLYSGAYGGLNANDVFSGAKVAQWLKATGIEMGGYRFNLGVIKDGNGNTKRVVTWGN